MTARRLLLPVAVLLALAASLVAGGAAPTPAHLPAVALGAVLVWRVEVAAVAFAALYGAVVMLRLALHGETLTRVGRDGIEVPRVGSTQREPGLTGADVSACLADLALRVERIGRRSPTSADPIDPLLRRDAKET